VSSGYDIFALADLTSDADNRAMIEAMGISPPVAGGADRNPTLAELASAIHDLGYKLDSQDVSGDKLTLWIRSPDEGGTEVTIRDYLTEPGDDTPRLLHFENGTPRLLLTIIEKLARRCGSLLLIESGMSWIIVEPGTEPDAPWTAT
jgi:hypothetical protein